MPGVSCLSHVLHRDLMARPMQVAFKHRKLELKMLRTKPAKFQQFLESLPIPGVLGPGNILYIVDHHHLAW